MDLFETFGEGLKNKITNTPEWAMHASRNPMKAPIADMADDLPF